MVTSFGSSPLRTTPIDSEYRAALIAILGRKLRERWGLQRPALRRNVIGLFELLLAHGEFAEGGRIALGVEVLARGLRRHVRWLSPLIDELQEVPELVTVVRLAGGGLGCNGQPSPTGHVEF